MDKLFLKYKVRMADILHATKKYNLNDDPEINAIKNAHKQKREDSKKSKAEDMKKGLLNSLPAGTLQEIKDEIASKGEINKTNTMDGMLDPNEFWKVFEIMVTLQIRFAHRITHEKAAERRALLKAGQKQ